MNADEAAVVMSRETHLGFSKWTCNGDVVFPEMFKGSPKWMDVFSRSKYEAIAIASRLKRDAKDSDELSFAEEVSSVLGQLDGLAEVWGDEGVFRSCRDRLRAALKRERSNA